MQTSALEFDVRKERVEFARELCAFGAGMCVCVSRWWWGGSDIFGISEIQILRCHCWARCGGWGSCGGWGAGGAPGWTGKGGGVVYHEVGWLYVSGDGDRDEKERRGGWGGGGGGGGGEGGGKFVRDAIIPFS
jgi:hypothetical protein